MADMSELIDELAAPVYRRRMAASKLSMGTDKQRYAQGLQVQKADDEIESIVRRWVKDNPEEG